MNVFDPSTYPQRIMLVGCGGTGAQWARSIARMLYDMQRRGMKPPRFTLVDPDVVEEKNVGRQLFTAADVGHYKAEVVATRLNYALGVGVSWIADVFKPDDHLEGKSTLLCGAVDNHEARRALHSVRYHALNSHLWIDAGNHHASGQVVIGNTTSPGDIEFIIENNDSPQTQWGRLPVSTLLFPDLLHPEPVEQPDPDASCAELVEAGAQHLLINDQVATVAAGYTYQVLHRQPIRSFMTFCDVETGAVVPKAITAEALAEYLHLDHEPVRSGENGHRGD